MVNKTKCHVSRTVEFIDFLRQSGPSRAGISVNNPVDNTSLSDPIISVFYGQFIERTEVGSDSDCCRRLKDKLR